MRASQRSDFVVVEVLEIALRALLFHQLFEPALRGLLFAGRSDAFHFEVVDELFDVDLYRRIADVVRIGRDRFASSSRSSSSSDSLSFIPPLRVSR